MSTLIPQLITAEEFRDAARISESTLARMRRESVGPKPIRIGRRFRYDAAEVAAYLSGLTR